MQDSIFDELKERMKVGKPYSVSIERSRLLIEKNIGVKYAELLGCALLCRGIVLLCSSIEQKWEFDAGDSFSSRLSEWKKANRGEFADNLKFYCERLREYSAPTPPFPARTRDDNKRCAKSITLNIKESLYNLNEGYQYLLKAIDMSKEKPEEGRLLNEIAWSFLISSILADKLGYTLKITNQLVDIIKNKEVGKSRCDEQILKFFDTAIKNSEDIMSPYQGLFISISNGGILDANISNAIILERTKEVGKKVLSLNNNDFGMNLYMSYAFTCALNEEHPEDVNEGMKYINKCIKLKPYEPYSNFIKSYMLYQYSNTGKFKNETLLDIEGEKIKFKEIGTKRMYYFKTAMKALANNPERKIYSNLTLNLPLLLSGLFKYLEPVLIDNRMASMMCFESAHLSVLDKNPLSTINAVFSYFVDIENFYQNSKLDAISQNCINEISSPMIKIIKNNKIDLESREFLNFKNCKFYKSIFDQGDYALLKFYDIYSDNTRK